MCSDINDTARCAPATVHITAVNWVCNGAVLQTCMKRADKVQDSVISMCVTGKQREDVQSLQFTKAVLLRDQVRQGGGELHLHFSVFFSSAC